MKKGILVYTEHDAGINKWFISHLTDELKKHGAELELFILDKHSELPENIDFCVNRSRFSEISKVYEEKEVLCFNNEKTIRIANDKWLTYLLCKELEIPAMKTEIFDGKQKMNYPFVLKSRNGHGGSEVELIESEAELSGKEFLNPSGYIAQEKCSDAGVDVRVYTLGGKPFAAVKRESKTDFRSNFSLGGAVELFNIQKEQSDAIEKLQSRLNTDYAGFDFILHNGKWILNEIEDAVGARMLYSLCDEDIVAEYAKYIAERIG